MKAAVYTRYGSPEVLQIKDLAMPSPGDKEILIRIQATSVNSGDVRLRKADPFAVRFVFGLLKPRINVLGAAFSGVVETVGRDVKLFKAGDLVFGHTDMRLGAHAEYICLPENGTLAFKPSRISHAEAAAIPFGGLTALHFLLKAKIRANQNVLIVGASGAVGTAAVQLAKSYGSKVTAVCSTSNIELVRSIGADTVIDYTTEDFTENGESYDLIFDTVNAIKVASASKSLTKNGILILSAAGFAEMVRGSWLSITSNKKALMGVISHTSSDLNLLRDLIEAGKFNPVIDSTYSMAQIADAHAYVEKGHKKGNIIIDLHNRIS